MRSFSRNTRVDAYIRACVWHKLHIVLGPRFRMLLIHLNKVSPQVVDNAIEIGEAPNLYLVRLRDSIDYTHCHSES